MKMISLTLTLAVLALSGASPALAKGDYKVGDCVTGDRLGKDGLWHQDKTCGGALSAAPSTTAKGMKHSKNPAIPVQNGPAKVKVNQPNSTASCVADPSKPKGCGWGGAK